MKRWASQAYPLALLGLLAALSFWLAHTADLPEPRRDGKQRHDPDTFVENFQVRKLAADGTLQYRLTAPLMRHFPDDDSSLLSEPRLTHYRGSTPDMVLSGRNGHVSAGGETVFFWENVVATRTASPGHPALVARMPDLTIQPDTGIAFTASPVEITQGNSWTRGIGMHLDNNTSVLVLKSQVTGTYHRPKTQQ